MTHLEAIAQIDHANFLIRKLNEELNKKESLIEIAVDTACGRDRIKEIRECLLDCIKQIIEGKKFLGLDCKKECQLIEQMKGGEK